MAIQSGQLDFEDAQPWTVVLAGGEGERLRPAVSRWLGTHRPKQYCTFVGRRSMLEHTWDRCRRLTSPERIISIVGSGHRRFLNRLGARPVPGTLIEQPTARGTLPGLMLPLTYVMAADPQAVVFVFPSDHFVYPEDRFLQFVRAAGMIASCRPDRLILLGAVPDGPESDYGWIEGEALNGGSTQLHQIRSFAEKPGRRKARRLYRNGGFWNTLVFAAKARLLWSLIEERFPESFRHFELLRRVLRAVRMGRVAPSMEQVALHHIYDSIDELDLSRDLLQQIPERLLLLPLKDVEWSDWGRPARIDDCLMRHGKAPVFSQPSQEPVAVSPFTVPVQVHQAVTG